jgi:hypothetical protein
MKPLLFALLLLAGLDAGAVEARRLPPVDGCARAPGFAAFRARLLRAVARHDMRFIRAMVAEDIVSSPGVYPGRRAFVDGWGGNSALWIHLEAMFRLGCARAPDGRVWVPALSLAATTEERAEGADFSSQVLILGARVPVRAAPSPESRVIATLNWDVVTAAPNRPGYDDWWWVRLADGRRGYVTGAGHLRRFGDFRAVFERQRGRWRMTVFATSY